MAEPADGEQRRTIRTTVTITVAALFSLSVFATVASASALRLAMDAGVDEADTLADLAVLSEAALSARDSGTLSSDADSLVTDPLTTQLQSLQSGSPRVDLATGEEVGEPLDVERIDEALRSVGTTRDGVVEPLALLANTASEPPADEVLFTVATLRRADVEIRRVERSEIQRARTFTMGWIALAMTTGAALIALAVDRHRRTERQASDESAAARLMALIDSDREPLACVGATGSVTLTSPSLAEASGWSSEAIVGVTFGELFCEDDRFRSTQWLHSFAEGMEPRNPIVRLADVDTNKYFSLSAEDLRQTATVNAIVVRFHDVTDELAVRAQLLDFAKDDPRHGIVTREYVLASITALHGPRRDRRFGILVTRVPEVVSRSPQESADIAREVVGRLRLILGRDAQVVRPRADEFMVFLPNVGGSGGLADLALAVRESLEAFVPGSGSTLTPAIGTVMAREAESPFAILRNLETALARADVTDGVRVEHHTDRGLPVHHELGDDAARRFGVTAQNADASDGNATIHHLDVRGEAS